jgi:hypothetical protein
MGFVMFDVDKRWETWDTYTRKTLAGHLNSRMVRNTQR